MNGNNRVCELSGESDACVLLYSVKAV